MKRILLAVILAGSCSLAIAQEKWEYVTKPIKYYGSNEMMLRKTDEELNKMGSAGWEVVQVIQWEGDNVILFKRKKK